MSEKQRIHKPKPVSGFPEWLPEERLVEQRWLDHIRRVFESYGFCSIETPSVEEIDVLLAKGEVDKEIYVLERLHKEEDDDKEARLALHFDQTVPFARYTAQHFNDLVFPFKRYQMQRVWRGERPQMGRMREFTQCDIDVINVDNLPLSFDAEIPAMIYEVLDGLDIGRVQIKINNRKILSGLLEHYEVDTQEKQAEIFRVIDKKEKLKKEDFDKDLEEALKPYSYNGVKAVDDVKAVLDYQNLLSKLDSKGQINFIKELLIALEKTEWIEFEKKHNLTKIHYFYHNFIQGFAELYEVLNALSHLPENTVVADLTIVRGLDYYTGTVYETQLLDVPEFTGSVCSGGRYDDLASQYINKKLPGVGISIGFSRLFDVIRQSRPDLLKVGPKSPTDIMIYTEDESLAAEVTETAQTLRANGYNVETYHTVKKWEKHLKYAEKKQIPFIGYIKGKDDFQVKNMATGDQDSADPKTWKKS